MSNRRDFIKRSGLALGGLALAPSISAASYGRIIGSGKRLNVALIGARNMGFYNLKDLLAQDQVHCRTICDVDQNVMAEKAAELVEMGHNRPRLETDYRKVLEDRDVDAVIIGTPDHWHCLPTVEACQAGKHVYVEKPLANSMAEIDSMLDAVARYGVKLQVGQQQRSSLHWKEAMDFVRDGKLGKVREVRYWANFNYGAGNMPVADSEPPPGVDYDRWLGPAPKRPFNPNRFHGSWRMFRDYGGGLMTDWGVHLIDMGLWAMDVDYSPATVRSLGGNFASRDRALEMPDTLTVLYEMKGFNMVWEHNGGVQSGPYDQIYGVKFTGTNGTLVADRDKWRVFPEWGGEDWRMPEMEEKQKRNDSHLDHCANFVNAIRDDTPLNAGVEVGHRAALYAHLGNISYWADERIRYDEAARLCRGSEKANELLRPTYREPWAFPGT